MLENYHFFLYTKKVSKNEIAMYFIFYLQLAYSYNTQIYSLILFYYPSAFIKNILMYIHCIHNCYQSNYIKDNIQQFEYFMQTLYYFISVLIILNKMIFVLFVMAYYLMLYILRKYNHFIGLIVFTLMCSLFFLCSLKMTVFFMLNLILLMCFEYLHFLFTFDHYFMNICTSL